MPDLRPPALPAALALALLAAASPAQAQTAAGTPAPTVLSHESVLSRYKRFEDAPAGPWRQANDTVGRIGGWRAYAREQAAPSEAATAPPAAPAAGAGHEGHHTQPARP